MLTLSNTNTTRFANLIHVLGITETCLFGVELFLHILQTSICTCKQINLLLVFIRHMYITVL